MNAKISKKTDGATYKLNPIKSKIQEPHLVYDPIIVFGNIHLNDDSVQTIGLLLHKWIETSCNSNYSDDNLWIRKSRSLIYLLEIVYLNVCWNIFEKLLMKSVWFDKLLTVHWHFIIRLKLIRFYEISRLNSKKICLKLFMIPIGKRVCYNPFMINLPYGWTPLANKITGLQKNCVFFTNDLEIDFSQ